MQLPAHIIRRSRSRIIAIYVSVIYTLAFHLSYSQQDSEKGYSVPVKTPNTFIKCLIVFAERDAACGPLKDSPAWPVGQLPVDANDYFDPQIFPTGPVATLTRTYHEASFGQYTVLGDYIDRVITVPSTNCGDPAGYVKNQVKQFIEAHEADPIGVPFPTKHGSPLSDFDLWNIVKDPPISANPLDDFVGRDKTNNSNNRIDVLIIIFRNQKNTPNSCYNGSAVWPSTGQFPMGSFLGFDNVGSFEACRSGVEGVAFVAQEYVHVMFGSNNWHSGAGAKSLGNHTFMTAVSPWGLNTQGVALGISNMACAWDRNHLGWKGWKNDNLTIQKDFLISALDESRNEVQTALTRPPSPIEQIFILRDFITTGDAVRIKLPHINFVNPGDVKDQYLWLENHQLIASTDNNDIKLPSCLNTPDLSPGIMAMIQVGKTEKTDQTGIDVFDPAEEQLNGQPSWLFPLTADGNFDYKFGPLQQPAGPDPCYFGGFHAPMIKFDPDLQPNPFTGYSDLWKHADVDGNGMLHSGDKLDESRFSIINEVGVQEFRHTYRGNENVSFKCGTGGCGTGKTILSLATNPAPVPVYTLANNFVTTPNPSAFDNRIIWLNGLSIEILEEIPNAITGGSDLKIRIKWDNYNVDQDVRWCGHINLSANDFDFSQPSLILKSGKNILLDRGISPTLHKAFDKDQGGNFILGDTTIFSCLAGSKFIMESNSTLRVTNKSMLRLKNFSKLEIQNGATLIVEEGSHLAIEDGAEIFVHDGGKIIIESSGNSDLRYGDGSIGNDPVLILDGNNSVLEIRGKLKIAENTDFTFTGNGFVRFDVGFQPCTGNPAWECSQNVEILKPTGANPPPTITLNGSGKEDKVLEIVRNTLSIPEIYGKFAIQNGRVELLPDARLYVGSPITLTNMQLTSDDGVNNGHRGLVLGGQPEAFIANAIFENGQAGIDAKLIWQGAPLTLKNVVIRNCDVGLTTQGKGISLFNVRIRENGLGWRAIGMDFSNRIFSNSQISFNDNGIQFEGTGSNSLILFDSHVDSNGVDGILVSGQTNLKMVCGSVRDNGENGIRLVNNATLNLSNDQNAGWVEASGNTTTISAEGANQLYLNHGQNNLTPSVSKSGNVVRGFLNGVKCPPPNPTVAALNNKWNSQNSIPAENVDYDLDPDPNSCAGFVRVGIVLDDPSPITVTGACRNVTPADPTDPIATCPGCAIINTPSFPNVPLNIAFQEAFANSGLQDTINGNDSLSISQFHEILTFRIPGMAKEDSFLIALSYEKIKETLGHAFLTGSITSTDNIPTLHPLVQKVIEVQDSLIARASTGEADFIDRFYISVDRALIFRLIDQRAATLKLLGEIETCLLRDDQRRFLERCMEFTRAEHTVLTDSVPVVNIDLLMPGILTSIIDPSASIKINSELGEGVNIGAGSVIGVNAKIGDDVVIGNNVNIGTNAIIGSGARIDDNTVIGVNTRIGKDCRIGKNVNVAPNVQIGNEVIIEDQVAIDEACIIGDLVTIREGASIQARTEIAEGTFIGPGAIIGVRNKIGINVIVREGAVTKVRVELGDGSIIGSNAVINTASKVGAGAEIADSITLGVKASICDNEQADSDIGASQKVGTCTSPTPPTPPFQTDFGCAFVMERARNFGDFLNGFRISNETQGTHQLNNKVTICVGDTLRFHPVIFSLGYLWDFGECSTSTDENPEFIFSLPGVYVINLTQDFGCKQVHFVSSIKVFPEPISQFTFRSTLDCAIGDDFMFSKNVSLGNLSEPPCFSSNEICSSFGLIDSSDFRLKFNWDFDQICPSVEEISTLGELLQGSDTAIACRLPGDGEYVVTLISTLQHKDAISGNFVDLSCVATFKDTISFNRTLKGDIVADSSYCAPDSVRYTVNLEGGHPPFSFFWNFGNGDTSSTGPTATAFYEGDGNFDVVVSVTDSIGCVDTFELRLFAIPPCLGTVIGVVSNNVICDGAPASNIQVSPVIASGSDTLLLGKIAPEFISTTNENGEFTYDPRRLRALADSVNSIPISFNTLAGAEIIDAPFKTLQQWIDDSPTQLTLAPASEAWTAHLGDLPDTSATLDTVKFKAATAIAVNGNAHVTGFINKEAGFTTGETKFVTVTYSRDGDTLWVKEFGSASPGVTSIPLAIAVNPACDVYVTGVTDAAGHADFLTIKYDSSGNLQWSRTFDANGNFDQANAIAVDEAGNIYVTGMSDEGLGDGPDYLTVKYDPDGNEEWDSRFDGSGNGFDQAHAIAVSGGFVYVTGESTASGTGTDMVTVKYDASNGGDEWDVSYNGSANANDRAVDIVVDADKNVYITGRSTETGKGLDITTIKYDSAGTEQWVQNFHRTGSAADEPFAMAIDRNSNVYVTGTSGSGFGEFPRTAVQIGFDVLEFDYTTIKYDKDGNEQWVRFFDGPAHGLDAAFDIAADRDGNVYVTGISQDTTLTQAAFSFSFGTNIANTAFVVGSGFAIASSFPPPPVDVGPSPADATTVMYDTDGNELWVERFKNPEPGAWSGGVGIGLDDEAGVYVTGFSAQVNTANSTVGLKFTTLKYEHCIPVSAPDLAGEGESSSENADAGTKPETTTANPPGVLIYPNPYNGYTNIQYSLRETSLVSIEVFTLLGKKVRQVVNAEQGMGDYLYVFSARAAGFNPGMYIMRFTVNDRSEVVKLIEQ